MEKALKYGLLAAAAGLGIYAVVKANQEEETPAAALPSAASLQPVLSYGDWRHCEHTAVNGIVDYWPLPAPPEVPGKTMIQLMVEYGNSTEYYPLGAAPYCINGNNYGVLLRPRDIPFTCDLRLVALYI